MPSFDWLYQAVLEMVRVKSDLFQSEVLSWVHSLGVLMLIVLALDWGLSAATGHHGLFGLQTMGRFVLTYLIVVFLIANYNTTIPWVGSSVQSLLPDFGQQITKMIQDGSVAEAENTMDVYMAKLHPPDSVLSTREVWYVVLELIIWVAQGLMFLLQNVGIVAVGVGGVLGVLSIPWLLLPGNSLFWDWLEFMLSWSMFQAVGAALVWVWAHAFLAFFAYVAERSMIDDLALLKAFAVLNVAIWWMSSRTYGIAQSLYGKAVGHAAGWAEHLKSYV
jgi:hypothetical protein